MRRACFPFEAWGAWQRSRFAARWSELFESCGSLRAAKLGVKKTASFGKSLRAQRLDQIYLAIWQIILHETDNDEQ
eukprot:scaffold32921_cov73-Phaeocystis_antarctica.AAC.6